MPRTPGPWRQNVLLVTDKRGGTIAHCTRWEGATVPKPEVAEANAAFIVRACNAHDELLAALKLAQLWLANCVPVIELDGPKPLPVIAAALAKVAGQP